MLRDVLHGWRMLAAAPVLSTVVVASLAIGIGVNTAVFSWVQIFALAPLPAVPRAVGVPPDRAADRRRRLSRARRGSSSRTCGPAWPAPPS